MVDVDGFEPPVFLMSRIYSPLPSTNSAHTSMWKPWAVSVLRSWIPYGGGIAIASSWIVSSLYFNYNTVEKRRAISNFVLCVLPRFSLHQNIYYTLLVTNNQAKIFGGFG